MKKIFNKKNIRFDFNFNKWTKFLNSISENSQLDIGGGWVSISCSEIIDNNLLINSKKILVTNAKSDNDILSFCCSNPSINTPVVFVVKLNKSNYYKFGLKILDDYEVVFLLDDSVDGFKDRFHLYNLIHKCYSQSKSWYWIAYYKKLINHLTLKNNLVDYRKISRSHIFKTQIINFFKLFFNKYDLWLFLSELSFYKSVFFKSPNKLKPIKTLKHILITGWYGTETAGDKAILMEMIYALRECNPSLKLSITSINTGLSHLTNNEFNLDMEVYPLKSINYKKLKNIDGVIFGGGPIMDSTQLRFINILFKWASCLGKNTILFGCGVGPLKTKKGSEWASSILKNTSSAFFRDEESANYARKLGFDHELIWSCDPALRYVKRWRENKINKASKQQILVGLLREQTNEYSNNASKVSEKLLIEIDKFLNNLKLKYDITLKLLPMHTFWYGNDDRDYIKKIQKIESKSDLFSTNQTYLLNELLENIYSANFGVPMRYHGHVFMLGLGIPFISLDYTGKNGKIYNLVKRYELNDISLIVENVEELNTLEQKFNFIEKNQNDLIIKMEKQVNRDIELLLNCYKKINLH